jgi:type VI secretion system protein VasD
MRGICCGVGLVVCALTCLAAGCASRRGSEAAEPIELTITSGDKLNPDDEGHPLPAAVRVYQLKAPAKMDAAEFDQVYRREKETLGEDLLRVDEFTLAPGDRLHRQVPRESAARAIAAVVLFRRPSGVHWRVISELPEGKSPSLSLWADEYRLVRGDGPSGPKTGGGVR